MHNSSFDLHELPDRARVLILTGVNGAGKTRALQYMSEQALKEGVGSFGRVVCLSGTVVDRFPMEKRVNSGYIYFGRKTNTNMFSEIAPFRKLVGVILENSAEWLARSKAALRLLEHVGLGGLLRIKFRLGRNTKAKVGALDSAPREMVLRLGAPLPDEGSLALFRNALRNGEMHVSSISLLKGSTEFEIGDLSSGERAYALSILALCFAATDGSVIFYDEPENSLHPSWQATIIRDMWSAIESVSNEATLIVATHSPLIVSGARNEWTRLIDLGSGAGWVSSELHGTSSDTVLKEQFRLQSARATSVIELFNRCLSALVNVETNPQAFRIAADELLSLGIFLDSDDPLMPVLEDIRVRRAEIV